MSLKSQTTLPKRLTGKTLRSLRTARGLSQFRLAALMNTTSSWLSNIERNDLALSSEQRQMIKEILDTWTPPRKKRNAPTKLNTPPSPGIATDCCDVHSVKTKKTKAPRVIAMFAGCGGFASGFSNAGFQIDGFVEIDSSARSTFRRNFSASKCLAHSVEDFSKSVKNYDGQIDVLIGGPPCQGFSLAGKRNPDDPRNSLFQHLVTIAEALAPKVIVMENVRLLLSMKNRDGQPVIADIQREFESIGYATSLWTMNAKDYGIPQSRERIFIVSTRADVPIPPLPAPTFSDPDSLDQFLGNKWKTFRDATNDLESLESGQKSENDPLHWAVTHPSRVINWLQDTPEGQSAHDNKDRRKRPPSGYNTTYKRLRWDEPSSTVSTNFGMISGSRNVHPKSTRSLTIREACRLQTFPDSYEFEGSWGDIRTQIGNAVPPALAQVVAEAVLKVL
jgi:DNA (cytosine-5)-methyltransferase 1